MRFYEIQESGGLTGPSLVSNDEIKDLIQNRKSPNFDLEDRIRYFYKNYTKDEFYFAIRNKRRIVAMAGMEMDPYDKSHTTTWIKFVSVDPKYRNRGLSKKLLKTIFEWADSNKKKLQFSSYTELGEKFIKPEIKRLSSMFPNVELIEG